jgi:hypothetical protein
LGWLGLGGHRPIRPIAAVRIGRKGLALPCSVRAEKAYRRSGVIGVIWGYLYPRQENKGRVALPTFGEVQSLIVFLLST